MHLDKLIIENIDFTHVYVITLIFNPRNCLFMFSVVDFPSLPISHKKGIGIMSFLETIRKYWYEIIETWNKDLSWDKFLIFSIPPAFAAHLTQFSSHTMAQIFHRKTLRVGGWRPGAEIPENTGNLSSQKSSGEHFLRWTNKGISCEAATETTVGLNSNRYKGKQFKQQRELQLNASQRLINFSSCTLFFAPLKLLRALRP